MQKSIVTWNLTVNRQSELDLRIRKFCCLPWTASLERANLYLTKIGKKLKRKCKCNQKKNIITFHCPPTHQNIE